MADSYSTSASLSDCRYELKFTPDPDIFKRGVRLENLMADLEELGTDCAGPGI